MPAPHDQTKLNLDVPAKNFFDQTLWDKSSRDRRPQPSNRLKPQRESLPASDVRTSQKSHVWFPASPGDSALLSAPDSRSAQKNRERRTTKSRGTPAALHQ